MDHRSCDTRVVRRRDRERATVLVLDVANVTFIAFLCFELLTFVSLHLDGLRRQAPWGPDPYDAVASLAMLLVPIVAALTWIRTVRWRSEPAYSPTVLLQIMRGCGVILVAIAATVITYVAAIMIRGFPPHASGEALLLAVLTIAAASLVASSIVFARSSFRLRSRLRAGAERWHDAPDTFDDVAGLLASASARLGALGARIRRLGEQLDNFVTKSRLSPRRHPWWYVVSITAAAGVGEVLTDYVHEGAPHTIKVALRVIAAFSLITMTSGLIGFAVLRRYLQLVKRS